MLDKTVNVGRGGAQSFLLSEFREVFVKKINEEIKPCPKCGHEIISLFRRWKEFSFRCNKCSYQESRDLDYDSISEHTHLHLPCFSDKAYELAIFILMQKWNTRFELKPIIHKRQVEWNYDLQTAPYDKRIWVLLEIFENRHEIDVFKKKIRDLSDPCYYNEKTPWDWLLVKSNKIGTGHDIMKWGIRPKAWCDFIEPYFPK